MKNEIILSDVIDEISMGPFGSDIKIENYISYGVPVLNGSNLDKFKLTEKSFNYVSEEKSKTFRKAIAKRGDVVITHRGTLGQISYIPENSKFEKYVISQSQFRVKFNNKSIDPQYIVYLFHSEYGQKKLLSFKNHVGVPALAQATTNFRNLRISIHKIGEQQKIAAVLSALDSKIELNHRINTELEAMAKTLYDYWFVQFDFPNREGKPYKTSGGQMVWSAALKREIPEGWEVKRVEDILTKEITKIKIPSSEYKIKGDIPIVDQSTDFIAGYTDVENAKILGKYLPRIIFGDHTRILKLINFDFARGADGTQILLSNNPRIPQHFFYHALLKIDLSNYGYARHFKFLKDTQIIEPDLNTVIQFEEKASSFYTMIRENIFQNQHLTALRDWLLPMLMNGQVQIDLF
jgi:type I restriction enzyme, S subunit